MEKEGLQRSLQFLTDEGLSVDTLITDRHVQIRKHMRMAGILAKASLYNQC